MPARPMGHCECLLGQGHSPVLCGMAPWPLGPTQAPVPSTNTQYQYPALALSISTQHQHWVLSTSIQYIPPVPSPRCSWLGIPQKEKMATEKGRNGQDESWVLTLFSATLACFYSFLITIWLLRVTSSRTLSSSVCCSAPTGHPPLGTPARFTKKGGESVAGWRETELSYLDIWTIGGNTCPSTRAGETSWSHLPVSPHCNKNATWNRRKTGENETKAGPWRRCGRRWRARSHSVDTPTPTYNLKPANLFPAGFTFSY